MTSLCENPLLVCWGIGNSPQDRIVPGGSINFSAIRLSPRAILHDPRRKMHGHAATAVTLFIAVTNLKYDLI